MAFSRLSNIVILNKHNSRIATAAYPCRQGRTAEVCVCWQCRDCVQKKWGSFELLSVREHPPFDLTPKPLSETGLSQTGQADVKGNVPGCCQRSHDAKMLLEYVLFFFSSTLCPLTLNLCERHCLLEV